MRKEKVVKLGELDVTVHELTVGEVRLWLQNVDDKKDTDVFAELLVDELSLTDLARFSTISSEQLDALTQSELSLLVATSKELNPYFFALRAKLMRFLPTS